MENSLKPEFNFKFSTLNASISFPFRTISLMKKTLYQLKGIEPVCVSLATNNATQAKIRMQNMPFMYKRTAAVVVAADRW